MTDPLPQSDTELDKWLQRQFDYVLVKATGKTFPGQRQRKVEVAKQAITKLIHKQELKAQIAELKRYMDVPINYRTTRLAHLQAELKEMEDV